VTAGRVDTLTDPAGRFVANGNPKGETVRVRVLPNRFDEIERTAVAGGAEVVLRVPARGRLHVRWKGSGRPCFRLFRGGTWDRPKDRLMGSGNPSPYYREEPGGIRFDLSAGTYGLRIGVPPGRVRVYPAIRVRADETVRITYDFPRYGRLTGRVLDAEGKPAEGAEIRLAANGVELATVDDRGRFEVVSSRLDPDNPELVAGRLRLEVRTADHASLYTEPIDLELDHDLDLKLVRGVTVNGRVVDQHGKGYRVRLKLPAPAGAALFHGWSRKDGTFRFVHVPPGRHRVFIDPGTGGRISHEFEVGEDDPKTVTIQVPR
jgi:hypothetical protein